MVRMNPGLPTQTGGLASSERGDIYADYADFPYLWIDRNDPHKRPKPPLGKVTVSSFTRN